MPSRDLCPLLCLSSKNFVGAGGGDRRPPGDRAAPLEPHAPRNRRCGRPVRRQGRTHDLAVAEASQPRSHAYACVPRGCSSRLSVRSCQFELMPCQFAEPLLEFGPFCSHLTPHTAGCCSPPLSSRMRSRLSPPRSARRRRSSPRGRCDTGWATPTSSPSTTSACGRRAF